jgi:hypothetical protein
MWHVREAVPVCLMEMCRSNLDLTSSEPRHNRSTKKLYKYDVSVSLQQTEDFLCELKQQLSTHEGVRVLATTADDASSNRVLGSSTDSGATDLLFCCFGHAGDENLHLNIIANFHFTSESHVGEFNRRVSQLQELLNTHIFALILQRRGTILSNICFLSVLEKKLNATISLLRTQAVYLLNMESDNRK